MNASQLIRQTAGVSDIFPRYYNLVSAGFVFGATYPAATVAIASATATGPFALFNPAASGVQLVLLAVTTPVITETPGATGAGIGFQFVPGQQPSATTPTVTAPQNTLVGSAAVAKGATFVAGTLAGAPTVPGYYSVGVQVITAGTPSVVVFKDDLAGAIVIQPNSGVDIVMSGTFVATIAPSLLWAEIPLG